MKNLFFAAAIASCAFAGAAFAQDASTVVCADYATMDNAAQMATLAELEALNSEMATSQELTSAEIRENLNDNCSANPDKLLSDAWKEMHM